MDIKVKFLGGAGTITGSKFLIEHFIRKNKMTFLVHGEKSTSDKLTLLLQHDLEWKPICPEYLGSFNLFSGF